MPDDSSHVDRLQSEFQAAGISVRDTFNLWPGVPIRFDDGQIPDWQIHGNLTLTSLEPADIFDDHRTQNAQRLIHTIKRLLLGDEQFARVTKCRLRTRPPKAATSQSDPSDDLRRRAA